MVTNILTSNLRRCCLGSLSLIRQLKKRTRVRAHLTYTLRLRVFTKLVGFRKAVAKTTYCNKKIVPSPLLLLKSLLIAYQQPSYLISFLKKSIEQLDDLHSSLTFVVIMLIFTPNTKVFCKFMTAGKTDLSKGKLKCKRKIGGNHAFKCLHLKHQQGRRVGRVGNKKIKTFCFLPSPRL